MALTEDYTFQLNTDGVILNQDDISFPFVDINRVDGLDSPDFRETIRDHEGVDGGFMDAEFEMGRNINLEGIVYADTSTMEDYFDNLKSNWAPSFTLIPLFLKVPGKDERVVFVKPRGVRYSWESIRRTGQSTVKFGAYAEDPRIYSSELITNIVSIGSTTTDGLGFPFGFPFGFGEEPTSPATDIINIGNRSSPIIMSISGPTTNPRIINDTVGKTLEFIITLGSADYLVIDTANRTVKLNGSANRRNSLVSAEWFDLATGSNFIRYQANTDDPDSVLTVQYRHAWR